ncbi:MAG: DUF3795 domain-containing protein [Candidatus Cryosericum sp.]
MERPARSSKYQIGSDRSETRITAPMIAPCGMDCGICSAYLRERDRCVGCIANGKPKQHHCDVCSIKLCAERAQDATFCFDCAKYPCRRLKQLDLRYRTKYGMSMIENLGHIRDLGLDVFVDNENSRWACPNCGRLICVHNRQCYTCGAQWNKDGRPAI